MTRRNKRTTYNYTLRKSKTVVYKGITKNPTRRTSEHKRSGKRFTSITTGPKVTRSTARRRESSGIKSYERSHGGKKPRYNKRG